MVGDVRSAGLYGCIEFKKGVEVTPLKKVAIERGIHLLVEDVAYLWHHHW